MLSLLRSCTSQGASISGGRKISLTISSFRCFATDRRSKGHDKPGRDRKNSVREKTRETGRKSANRTDVEESNIAGMKDILNKMDEGVNIPLMGSSKGKLGRGLVKTQTFGLSSSAQGSLDAHGEDISELLNEALETDRFMYTFPGVLKTSEVIEFQYVKLNPDVSHVTAYWRSDMIESLVLEILKIQVKERELRLQDIDFHFKNGIPFVPEDAKTIREREEKKKKQLDAKTVLDRAEKHVNKYLKIKEGLFRTYIAKHMEFRRVPRIFFEISDGQGLRQEIATGEGGSVKAEYERNTEANTRNEFMQHLAAIKEEGMGL